MQALNVIDTAVKTGIFQTFSRLLEGSQLERQLRSQQPYTLFAPVDIAFAYLTPEAFNRLLQAENQGMLAEVLGYHVVSARIMSGNLRSLRKAKTIYGAELSIQSGPEPRVGGVKIRSTNPLCRRGPI